MPTKSTNPPRRAEQSFKGTPLSPGLALGRICLFNEYRHSNLPEYRVSGTGIRREERRVRRAVVVAAERLDELRLQVAARIGPAEAEIFTAQKMILQDASLAADIVKRIREQRVNAETAITDSLQVFERRFQEMDDAYLKDRATDIGEVRRRLLDVLGNMRPGLQCQGGGQHCQRGYKRIVVAEELTPSLSIELDTEDVLAFVTVHGGANSHAAILARGLGVPAVSGIPGIREQVRCGDEIWINGDTGEVVLHPAPERLAAVVAARQAREAHAGEVSPPVPGFAVFANVSSAEEVRQAVAAGAEGIGLYRTEFELLQVARVLTEEEQVTRYQAVLAAAAGRPVTFRLFDLGSDKQFPALGIPAETNPALGWRGARLLLGRPELFGDQARAIVRAAAGQPVRVLYPMITDAAQFLELKRRFLNATGELDVRHISHGVMFEVPAACLEADSVLAVADFASIGTNDLTQYLFAVDRDNDLVAGDFSADQPALWRVLDLLVQAAAAAGKSLTLCGELGGNPLVVPRLIGLGLRTVSVAPRLITSVRAAARPVLTA
jgi:phosphoenolpyruvate-protein phosphotransferase